MAWHPAVAAAGQQERYVRVDQAAAKLCCTPRRVRQLCQDKLLAGAIKVGPRKWLIPESAIRKYHEAINQE
ncbi:MAG: hypothetical protein M1438_04780 [Deltaproteobacteria bacterium]|nr:hypothetical protein [Deltaproteobacteria bacterium]